MKSHFATFKDIMKMALPLIAGHLGHTLTGAVDVLVAARYSVNALAAVSVANAILFSIFICGIGIAGAVSILISNGRGAGKPVRKYLISSVLISQILATVFALICLSVIPFIDKFGFDPVLISDIKEYMFIVSFSLFGMYLYQALKEFLQAYEIVAFPNALVGLCVVLNYFLNTALVNGICGIPPLGVKGLAIATLIVRSFMGIALLLYCRFTFFQKHKMMFSPQYFKKVLLVGVPIGFGLLAEFLGFNLITAAVARQSGLLAATHNILITLSSATFTVPLGIAGVISVKTAFFSGARNFEKVVEYSKVGVSSCVLFMSLCGVMFFAFPKFFINLFTSDLLILQTAVPVVAVLALFQVADGLQISLGGVLKGLKMTKEVTTCVITCYWLFGVPAGFFCAYVLNMSLKGFWTGIALALFLVAITECILISRKFKRLSVEFKS